MNIALFVLLLAARAQETDVPPETPAPPSTPAPAETPALGFILRMPPDAFPEPRVRGMRGGSLWMTFHGLQWPFMRRSGIGVSGYAWIDSGYEQIDRGNKAEQNIQY